ncbi:MAG: hypothetical protein R3321_15205 [Nitrososphaeraceae archaeon]|nr:hypothetical protein [Nitrososphaeraceae archaeon]
MFFSKRRIVLFGVIGALALTIILIPEIQYLVNAPDADAIEFKLANIEINSISNDTNNVELLLSLDVHNPTDKTATTSKVEYDLFGNNEFLGHGVLSYEDIPLNGRPQLHPQQTTTLKSTIILEPTDSNLNLIQDLITNSTSIGDNNWEVIGQSQIESAFVIVEKQFESTL